MTAITSLKPLSLYLSLCVSQMPELLSRLPVSKLFDVGAKTLNIARYWPAGLASLVVGTAPTTGAIVGVIAISIFIIIIWLCIYSTNNMIFFSLSRASQSIRLNYLGIGVLPVGASLFSGGDYANLDPPYPVYPEMFPQPVHPAHAYGGPYNHRFQRSLADTSRTVMNAIDQFELKNN